MTSNPSPPKLHTILQRWLASLLIVGIIVAQMPAHGRQNDRLSHLMLNPANSQADRVTVAAIPENELFRAGLGKTQVLEIGCGGSTSDALAINQLSSIVDGANIRPLKESVSSPMSEPRYAVVFHFSDNTEKSIFFGQHFIDVPLLSGEFTASGNADVQNVSAEPRLIKELWKWISATKLERPSTSSEQCDFELTNLDKLP